MIVSLIIFSDLGSIAPLPDRAFFCWVSYPQPNLLNRGVLPRDFP